MTWLAKKVDKAAEFLSICLKVCHLQIPLPAVYSWNKEGGVNFLGVPDRLMMSPRQSQIENSFIIIIILCDYTCLVKPLGMIVG